ncbi:MAG: type 4a pilus biogenesis protein PilO [Candidatus Omnitrophica bacterium]|nr:type 4a pilus biogenesis protein PilO [Candidatus Omnitrophota bacterium]
MNNTEYSKERLMDLFSKNKKKILAVGIIIIITMIISSALHKSQNRKIEMLSTRKEAELKKSDILREIGQSEKAIKLYKNTFTKKDPSSITNTLAGLAKDSDVTLVSIKPGNEENQPFYTKTSFNMLITANSYHALGKFISKIENEPDIYFIDEIKIKAQEKTVEQDQELIEAPKPENEITVNLTLSTIAFKG